MVLPAPADPPPPCGCAQCRARADRDVAAAERLVGRALGDDEVRVALAILQGTARRRARVTDSLRREVHR